MVELLKELTVAMTVVVELTEEKGGGRSCPISLSEPRGACPNQPDNDATRSGRATEHAIIVHPPINATKRKKILLPETS
jgi:hypothetical protein